MVGADELGYIDWRSLDREDCMYLMQQALDQWNRLEADLQRHASVPGAVRDLLNRLEKDRTGQ